MYIKKLLIAIVLFGSGPLYAQEKPSDKKELSLNEAIALARQQNKSVETAKMEEQATMEDQKDAKLATLPRFDLNAGYQRYSNLSVYQDGLGGRHSSRRFPTPNQANAGIEGAFTIYAGGKIKAFQEELAIRTGLASLNTRDLSGNISLQTAAGYLDLMRLIDLKKFTLDQKKRAELRLKNINAFYQNQKVTRSDVLRAELMLSNVKLSLVQTENDINITSRRLDVLLNLPESTLILPKDVFDQMKPELPELLALLDHQGENAFSVLKSGKNIQLQQSRLNSIKSNNLPTLNFSTAYGFNYPNFQGSPPVDQMYSIGFVGLKAQYNISSLYQNKGKINAAKWRIKESETQKEYLLDQIRQESESYYIKYLEALNRIEVSEKSIQQAEANYKIISTKYFNQLALLTDLLDADYLFQESRFNLIKAQTDAIMVYYRMLYTTGKL